MTDRGAGIAIVFIWQLIGAIGFVIMDARQSQAAKRLAGIGKTKLFCLTFLGPLFTLYALLSE